MTPLQFKDDPPTVLDGWYWMKHKDSDVPFIGHLVKGPIMLLGQSGQLSEENFHHYLYAGPLRPPTEKSLGTQMAIEADNNRLISPREMLQNVLDAMDDPEDVLNKVNKGIFIGLYQTNTGHYHSATLRSNMSNSEAVALLMVKATEFCREISGDDNPTPEA